MALMSVDDQIVPRLDRLSADPLARRGTEMSVAICDRCGDVTVGPERCRCGASAGRPPDLTAKHDPSRARVDATPEKAELTRATPTDRPRARPAGVGGSAQPSGTSRRAR